jgi:hypothetical protein
MATIESWDVETEAPLKVDDQHKNTRRCKGYSIDLLTRTWEQYEFWRLFIIKKQFIIVNQHAIKTNGGYRKCWHLFRAPNTQQEPAAVLSAQARTVRDQGPDGPRPEAGAKVSCLTVGRSAPTGRTVRACAEGGEGRRRRLDLAPGRDPVGEERS